MAERGTLMHAAIETGQDAGLTDDELELVQKARAYVKPLIEQADKVVREIRVYTQWPDCWGTADLLCIKSTHGDLCDYKFGWHGVDDAEVNLQGQTYLEGVFRAYPELESVRVHFILPRRDEVTAHTYYRSEMENLRLRIARVVARADELAGKEFTPTEKACLFCSRKATCPAMASKALSVATNYDQDFQLPAEFHPSQISDPAQMARALTVARVLDKWTESVKHHGTEMAKQGFQIPGFALRYRQQDIKVKDVQAAYSALQDQLTLEEFLPACTVNLGAIQKTVAAKAPRGQKGQVAEEVVDRLVSAGIALRSGEPTPYLAKARS